LGGLGSAAGPRSPSGSSAAAPATLCGGSAGARTATAEGRAASQGGTAAVPSCEGWTATVRTTTAVRLPGADRALHAPARVAAARRRRAAQIHYSVCCVNINRQPVHRGRLQSPERVAGLAQRNNDVAGATAHQRATQGRHPAEVRAQEGRPLPGISEWTSTGAHLPQSSWSLPGTTRNYQDLPRRPGKYDPRLAPPPLGSSQWRRAAIGRVDAGRMRGWQSVVTWQPEAPSTVVSGSMGTIWPARDSIRPLHAA
jgi:hypothetical protein